MLSYLRKITMEQWFILAVYVLSLMLAFAVGYLACRYEMLEFCKSPIKLVDLQGN